MRQVTNRLAVDSQAKEVVILTQAAPAFTNWLLFLFSLFSMTFTYLTYRQGKGQQPTGQSLQPSKLNSKLQTSLHDVLDTYFNEQELRNLCFDMGIDYEDLPFSGQSNKARELVACCARLGRLPMLQQQIEKERPSLFKIPSQKRPTSQINLPVA
ncbi:MAG: hypothetical protein DHS20C20_19940 [Ardenticatenaceae bacterium]|nr:MAG: hypothetical protein DHS20C20_19940 [Ardenticatenaceae bacterium]